MRGRESPRISVRFGDGEWQQLRTAEEESGQPITRILRIGVDQLLAGARQQRTTLGRYVQQLARRAKGKAV